MSVRPEDESSTPVPVYVVPELAVGDHIRLTDLLGVVSRQKQVIFLSFLVCALMAAAYSFLAEPVYRSVTHLLPPKIQDIQALKANDTDSSFDQFTPEFVYSSALENLQSQGLRRRFFDQFEIANYFLFDGEKDDLVIDQIFDEEFNEKLKIAVDKDSPVFVTVSLDYRDPVVVADWLNRFVDMINKETIQQLSSDLMSVLEFEKEKIRAQLDSKLKLAKKRRIDEKSRLLEALSIAKSLGISDSGLQQKNVETGMETKGLMVNTAHIPLYMRGTKALDIEISVLDSRKSEEPFIVGYRDLEERLSVLEGVVIDSSSLSAFTLDTAAVEPYRAIKPRKLFVILLGSIAGLVVGLFLALALDTATRVSGKVL